MHDQLFQTLKKDHQEVKSLFKKLTEAKKANEREELLEKLDSEITPHMRAEERTVYMALQKKKEAKEDALEAFEEHHAARLVMHELQDLSADDERFLAKSMVLKEMVEHHLKEEEKDIFQDIREGFSADEAGKLLERFNQEKERIKKKLH